MSFGVDPETGKRDRRTVTASTEDECWARVEELERQRRRGVRRRPTDTVEAWVEQWLAANELALKPSTLQAYRSLTRCYILPRLGDIRLEDLTAEDVERMLAWMTSTRGPNVSATTATNARRTLAACLASAIKRGKLSGPNVARIARAPRIPHAEVEPLTIEEVRSVLASASASGRPNAARWTVGLALGLRQGEALGLRVRDVDLDQGTLTVAGALARKPWQHGCRDPRVCAARHCRRACPAPCPKHPSRCPSACRDGCQEHAHKCPRRVGGGLVLDSTKTGRSRIVALPQPLVHALRDHIAEQRSARFALGLPLTPDSPLFASDSGGWIEPKADWKAWRRLLEDAGVAPTRLHTARHTAASTLLAQGVPARTVMDVLGWSQISLTVRYQHVIDPLRRDAADRIGAAIWGTDPERQREEGSA